MTCNPPCDDWGCDCFYTQLPESKEPDVWKEESKETDSCCESVVWKDVKRNVKRKESKEKYLNCRVCSDNFIYTIRQQRKYMERGWNAPKTCKKCVQQRHKLVTNITCK